MKTTTRSRARPSTLLASLTLALLFLGMLVVPAFAQGGDHGACPDGYWIKADWSGGDWSWEEGPAWDTETPAPSYPNLNLLEVKDDDPDEPWKVAWTSDVEVASVHVKAGEGAPGAFPGGYNGEVTGLDGKAISFIVFCYGPPPPVTQYADLLVTKTVVGDAADAVFTFDAGGETFNLADAEDHTIEDLEVGSQITVTETATAGADHTTVDGTPGLTTTITISADGNQVDFVNTFDEDGNGPPPNGENGTPPGSVVTPAPEVLDETIEAETELPERRAEDAEVEVLGTTLERAEAETEVLGESLPRTGADASAIALLAAMMLLLGSVLLRATRLEAIRTTR